MDFPYLSFNFNFFILTALATLILFLSLLLLQLFLFTLQLLITFIKTIINFLKIIICTFFLESKQEKNIQLQISYEVCI